MLEIIILWFIIVTLYINSEYNFETYLNVSIFISYMHQQCTHSVNPDCTRCHVIDLEHVYCIRSISGVIMHTKSNQTKRDSFFFPMVLLKDHNFTGDKFPCVLYTSCAYM